VQEGGGFQKIKKMSADDIPDIDWVHLSLALFAALVAIAYTIYNIIRCSKGTTAVAKNEKWGRVQNTAGFKKGGTRRHATVRQLIEPTQWPTKTEDPMTFVLSYFDFTGSRLASK
jgi:hypothetical protein